MPQVRAVPGGAVQLVSLYSREGGSDKVYHIGVFPARNGFRVMAYSGRRISPTLTEREKSGEFPVPMPEARHIMNQIVREKERKGYRERGAHEVPRGGRLAERFAPVIRHIPPPPANGPVISMFIMPAGDGPIIGLTMDENGVNAAGLHSVKESLTERGMMARAENGEAKTIYTFDMTGRARSDLAGLNGQDAGQGKTYSIRHIGQPDWQALIQTAEESDMPFEEQPAKRTARAR